MLNKKLEEKLKIFDDIDKIYSNKENNKNTLYSLKSNEINKNIVNKKKYNLKNSGEINNNFNNIYSNFDINHENSLYYEQDFFQMSNYLKTLKQKIKNNSINNSNNKISNIKKSKNNKNQKIINKSNKKTNNSQDFILIPKKENVVDRLLRYGKYLENKKKLLREDIDKQYMKKSVPKNSIQNKQIENDPEKFVERLFYNKNNNKEKDNKNNYMNNTVKICNKININNKNFTYRPKISQNSQKIAQKLGPSSIRLYKKNKKINKEEIENMANNSYTNLFKAKIRSCSNSKEKKKNNNSKIQKIINKLYNEGIKDLHNKELIYKENVLKKDEEYKKYPFRPNTSRKRKNKSTNHSFNYESMSLEKLNNDMYTKQIEWKNKKDEYNQKRKQFEEELFLCQKCTFKPNISREFIKDDEKIIKRNLKDMNNYIIKRRNQIYNTKDNGFNLRSYNTSKIINENNNMYNSCINLKKSNNNKYYNGNNYIKGPYTDREYLNREEEELNCCRNNNYNNINYSQMSFIDAVNALHNEINNLNI